MQGLSRNAITIIDYLSVKVLMQFYALQKLKVNGILIEFSYGELNKAINHQKRNMKNLKLEKSLRLRKWNKLNKDLLICLNILYLLKSKPMKYEELLKSGHFRSERDLENGIRRLFRANCIEKIKAVGLYVILGNGISFLSMYPNWTPLPVELLDVIVPIGRERYEERGV